MDDLCGCDANLLGEPSGAIERPPAAGSSDEATRKAASSAPQAEGAVRFVLYFDFSELQLDGPVRALREAEKWVREVKTPADQVMVAAYATASGLRVLSAFTADSRALLSAIEKTSSDPGLADAFPVLFESRVLE